VTHLVVQKVELFMGEQAHVVADLLDSGQRHALAGVILSQAPLDGPLHRGGQPAREVPDVLATAGDPDRRRGISQPGRDAPGSR
jgi:hypothetical protein